MQVIVDNILTSYKKYGSGKKVILFLPGWGDTIKGFALLGKFSPKEYTVVLLDLPGFGGTERPHSSWGLPEYSEFIARFLQKINLNPYALVGHSNGGAISVLAVGSKRIAPKKLILIGSSGVRSGASARKVSHKIGAKIVKAAIFFLPENTQNNIKKKLYTKIGSDYMVIDGLQDTFKKVVSYDVINDANKITIPTLLIYGSNDFITPKWQAEKISKAIKNSKLKIIDHAEHFPHKDRPEEVKKIIDDFLK